MQLLDEQHELLWHVFEDMKSNEIPRGTESWTKCAKVHATLSSWKSLNWLDAAAYISLRSHNDGALRVDFRRGGSFHAEFSQVIRIVFLNEMHIFREGRRGNEGNGAYLRFRNILTAN